MMNDASFEPAGSLHVPVKRSGIAQTIAEFYDTLPFNYHSSVASAAEGIRSSDAALRSLPFLKDLLAASPAVVDVGCGAGWFSNSIAYHYGRRCTGIDLSRTALEQARSVAQTLGMSNIFECTNLFDFRPTEKFDLVWSMGVLHHTEDARQGFRHLADNVVAPGGRLLVGLYHRPGREPFLDHFRRLRNEGKNDDELMNEFFRLYRGNGDDAHRLSWFRDQVLHPHETLHTVAEMQMWIEESGCHLERCSLDGFSVDPCLSFLEEAERETMHRSRMALENGRFFPGFIVVLARKGIDSGSASRITQILPGP